MHLAAADHPHRGGGGRAALGLGLSHLAAAALRREHRRRALAGGRPRLGAAPGGHAAAPPLPRAPPLRRHAQPPRRPQHAQRAHRLPAPPGGRARARPLPLWQWVLRHQVRAPPFALARLLFGEMSRLKDYKEVREVTLFRDLQRGKSCN